MLAQFVSACLALATLAPVSSPASTPRQETVAERSSNADLERRIQQMDRAELLRRSGELGRARRARSEPETRTDPAAVDAFLDRIRIAVVVLMVCISVFLSTRRTNEDQDAVSGGEDTGHLTREGAALIIPRGGDLPRRCIKCNGPTFRYKRRRYSRHSTALRAVIGTGLCERHNHAHYRTLTAAWFLVVVGLAVAVNPALDGRFILWGSIAATVGFLWAMRKRRPLRAIDIDGKRTVLVGAGRAFLESLPGA